MHGTSAGLPQDELTGELRPPSLPYVMTVVLVSYLIFLLCLFLLGGSYWSLVGGQFGDNPDYLRAAWAIRHWTFTGADVKQFWGVSYAVAAVWIVTRISEGAALVVVCVGSSLVSVAFCYRLFGGWVAVFFSLLSFDWFQRSLLGGAEPLFVALLLGSFLALRRERWTVAAVLASLSTVVRPFGIFALAGLGIHLLYRKRFRDCAVTTAIGLVIGGLYMWPLGHYLGNPLANVAAYKSNDWHGGLPFGFPLAGIFRNTFPITAPLTNLVLSFGWIVLVLVGLVVAIRSGDFREYARRHTAEACFVLIYYVALYTYSAPEWARSNFPRFALPLLPWILFFLRRYLPANRRVVWALAVVMPCLAAASTVNIRHAASILMRHFH